MRDLQSFRILRFYYAATLLFVLLDYVFNINVRLAFLDAMPTARAAYYLLCLTCLALIVWRPDLGLWIGTVESLLSLSLLIVTTGTRVMTVSEPMLVDGSGPVTTSEIVNFMLVGGAAWLAWHRGMQEIGRSTK